MTILSRATRVDVAASIVLIFNVAVAYPLLDVLGRSAEFFVARDASGFEVAMFGILIAFVIPITLAAIVLVLRALSPRTSRGFHAVLLWSMLIVLCLQTVDRALAADGWMTSSLQLSLSAVVAGAMTYAYFASDEVRSVARAGFFAPLAVIILFLLISPASRLVFPQGPEVTPLSDDPEPVPIVMMVFDEFPIASIMDAAGSIDGANFPNFDRLADEGTWFRNATTIHESTTFAIPAMLTGMRPRGESLPIYQDHPNNIFRVLQGSHALNVREPITSLCPPDLCRGDRSRPRLSRWISQLASDTAVVAGHIFLIDDLADDLPSINDQWVGFAAEPMESPGGTGLQARFGEALDKDRASTFESFFEEVGAPGESSVDLHFLHSMLPHHPWEYLPSGRLHGAPPKLRALDGKTWIEDEWLVAQAYQRHLLQVGYVDRLVGRVIDELKRKGTYRETLLIVTADHGAGFTPGRSRRTVAPATVGEIAAVPLFVKVPGTTRGGTSDRPASTTDILPTIADVLEVELPWQLDGYSLLADDFPKRRLTRIGTRSGNAIEFPADGKHKDAAVARKYRWFHHEDGAIDPYALEPFGALRRRALGNLEVNRTGVSDDRSDSYRLVSTPDSQAEKGRSSRTYLGGRYRAATRIDEPVYLAIVVDGRVEATTRTFDHRGNEGSFEALLPPSAQGSGRIEILRVTGVGTLAPLRNDTEATYQIVHDGTRTALAGSTGVRFAVREGAIDGVVETIRIDGHALVVGGWAGDTARGLPVESIVVFADERFLYYGLTSTPRGAVAEAFGEPGLVHSGFRVEVPASDLEGTPLDKIRVFAVLEGEASELRVHNSAY